MKKFFIILGGDHEDSIKQVTAIEYIRYLIEEENIPADRIALCIETNGKEEDIISAYLDDHGAIPILNDTYGGIRSSTPRINGNGYENILEYLVGQGLKIYPVDKDFLPFPTAYDDKTMLAWVDKRDTTIANEMNKIGQDHDYIIMSVGKFHIGQNIEKPRDPKNFVQNLLQEKEETVVVPLIPVRTLDEKEEAEQNKVNKEKGDLRRRIKEEKSLEVPHFVVGRLDQMRKKMGGLHDYVQNYQENKALIKVQNK